MAAEIHGFTAIIPASTPKSALVVIPLPLNNFEIESIDVEVPPGPAGLMGFYLAISGQQWIPWESGEFMVWDDREKSWPLNDQPTSEGWQVVGYNLDAYDHEVVVRFHVNVPASPLVTTGPSVTFITTNVTAQPALVI